VFLKKYLLLLSLSLTLAGCGGGGGGSASVAQAYLPVASPSSFNFQSAWQKFVSNPYSKKFVVSGSCSGSMEYTHSAVGSPFPFDNATLRIPHPTIQVNPGYYVANRMDTTSTLPGCITSSSITNTTAYYDAKNLAPFGYIGGTAYNGASRYTNTFREYASNVILPATVKVGDSGVVGTINIYGFSGFNKDGILQGKIEVSFIVEADTEKTAIVNIISKSYGINNNLTMVDQSRYLIGLDETLSFFSVSQQYFDNLNINLIAR
jgi:hypothetical protein